MLAVAIVITEFPKYTISVFFGSIAWLMLACLEHQRKRPSPWAKPPTYLTLLWRFITNGDTSQTIQRNERQESDHEYLKMILSRQRNNKAIAKHFWEDINKDWELMEEMYADRSNRQQNSQLKPLMGALYPIQKTIFDLCIAVRLSADILSWDQIYLSFWITTVAIILSFASIFIWDEVLLWTKRIFLYGLCGPWMRVLDVFYFSKMDALTQEQKENLRREKERFRRNRYRKAFLKIQERKEEQMKEEAMKVLLFGTEIIVVPDLFTPERYKSIPKYESSAHPNQDVLQNEVNSSYRRRSLIGQRLVI
jgi:hypothetical protein